MPNAAAATLTTAAALGSVAVVVGACRPLQALPHALQLFECTAAAVAGVSIEHTLVELSAAAAAAPIWYCCSSATALAISNLAMPQNG